MGRVFQSDLSLFYNYAWTHLDIWVMKEYGVKRILDKVSNEGEILLPSQSGFAKYNPKDDSIKHLDVTNIAPCLEVEIYVMSLVCPF
ncbi:hypothetical protein P3L10_010918 [Capsicum annuum]